MLYSHIWVINVNAMYWIFFFKTTMYCIWHSLIMPLICCNLYRQRCMAQRQCHDILRSSVSKSPYWRNSVIQTWTVYKIISIKKFKRNYITYKINNSIIKVEVQQMIKVYYYYYYCKLSKLSFSNCMSGPDIQIGYRLQTVNSVPKFQARVCNI